jgi:hypothetical protein
MKLKRRGVEYQFKLVELKTTVDDKARMLESEAHQADRRNAETLRVLVMR